MECDFDTKIVRVLNVEGDQGPVGPMGPPGPAGAMGPIGSPGTGIPVWVHLHEFVNDGSVLIAHWRPPFGIRREDGKYIDQICCHYVGGNAALPNLIYFLNAERTEIGYAFLGSGWVYIVF